ncbi:MAG TPA: hypothetical protein VHE37_12440, partial [Nevskiaceae bacterium]|nr:hypothetical protein [Nevskiaceae bacterium]
MIYNIIRPGAVSPKIAATISVALLALTGCGRSLPGATENVADAGVAPAKLSQETQPADMSSSDGSGVFGAWTLDRYGLPAYDYTLDQVNDARAQRVELSGTTSAWHQLGNDAIVANAYNDGYVQLWSSQRLYQWVNLYDASKQHYGGGYGYLRANGATTSTLWLDRPAGVNATRRFGMGYVERDTPAGALDVREAVTAPFGDATALVHEIVISNSGGSDASASWWEYWDANPALQITAQHVAVGLMAPAYDDAGKTVSIAQIADGTDTDPLSIFLTAVDAPVSGFETDAKTFFGAGGRAAPDAVSADAPTNSVAAASLPAAGGSAMLALRAPVSVPAHGSVTLRYVYGLAHAADIAGIVSGVAAQANTQAATASEWAARVPRADFGADKKWLARELAWDYYQTRSASLYEESCGHHIITQGGYYQYGLGEEEAFRDPLQHMLPMVYSAPELAREVLRYSLQEQPPDTGVIPYGMAALCTRFDFGASDDLDFWLLLSAVEYVLGTRDFAFLDESVDYRGGVPVVPGVLSGTVWDHLKLAYHHQEDLVGRGIHGQYNIGPTGDWSDLSPVFLQITESTLVTAQLAYIYPRLEELALAHGDLAFAQQLHDKAATLHDAVSGEWTGRGWYSRGYSGTRQLGSGAIYGEPQPWAILAGIPDDAQAATLVNNIARYLTGIGAPAELHGPALIGSSISPAKADPDISEFQIDPNGVGDGNAVYVGGAWYAIDGPLAWAQARLDGRVPGAAERAWDELLRNTLKTHAQVFPQNWDGVINVDDACWSFYASDPSRCGIGIIIQLGGTAGQITHQPAWGLYTTLKLSGIEPTGSGYDIRPHVPLAQWSLKLPLAG